MSAEKPRTTGCKNRLKLPVAFNLPSKTNPGYANDYTEEQEKPANRYPTSLPGHRKDFGKAVSKEYASTRMDTASAAKASACSRQGRTSTAVETDSLYTTTAHL